ncbi:MAG: hypothetical protein WCH99_16300 [Verrucomicrobiota bacterium]
MRIAWSFILLSLLLLSCGRNDAKMQRELPGTWVAVFPNGVQSTVVVNADGSYSCQHTRLTNGVTLSRIEGTIQIRDGLLIDTVTKHSSTNAKVPFMSTNIIVHMNKNEIVEIEVGEFSSGKPVTLKKVQK